MSLTVLQFFSMSAKALLLQNIQKRGFCIPVLFIATPCEI
jgi:hypothetical protein